MTKSYLNGAITALLLSAIVNTSCFGAEAATPSAKRKSKTENIADEKGGGSRPSATKQATQRSKPQDPQTTVLEEMTVIGQPMGEVGYKVPNATTATKTDTPIMETPVSVQVVPRSVIEDQQVIRLEDALKNISSVQGGGESALIFQNEFTVRGFNLGANVNEAIYRNGVRLTSVNIVPSGLEQVEVVKGPAALLYGRLEPGALINVITKKPSRQRYYALQQQFGSFDLYRSSLDATGPLDQEGKLLYRLNFDYLDRNSFRDFLFQDQAMVRPSLTWHLTDNTQLNLNYEFQTADFGDDLGIPAIGDRPADIPISRNLSDPGFGNQEREDHIGELDLVHRFNPDWEVHWQGVYANEQRDQDNMFAIGTVNEQTGELQRGVSGFRLRDHETWSTSLNLTGRLDLFGTEHRLLIGGDYYNEERKSRGLFTIPNFGPIPSINIFNPVFGGIPRFTDSNFASAQAFPFLLRNEWYGIYLQDQIVLFDRLHLLLGGRFDSASATLGNQKINTDDLNPRYGILYQPVRWLSLYGHYVTSLGLPNPGLGVTNSTFKPEEAEQFEAGIKTELFEGQLTATVALFELTKKNILTPDPNNPLFSVATGEARSRGVELDISGRLTDKLSLIGSYAYLDTEITEDNRGNEGNRLINAPRHSGSIWTKYNVFDGFNVGAGVFAASQREMDLANTAQMPGYVRVDAMASYRWKIGLSRLTAQFNVQNLLDKEYFQSASLGGDRTAFPGAERTFIGSIRLEY